MGGQQRQDPACLGQDDGQEERGPPAGRGGPIGALSGRGVVAVSGREAFARPSEDLWVPSQRGSVGRTRGRIRGVFSPRSLFAVSG